MTGLERKCRADLDKIERAGVPCDKLVELLARTDGSKMPDKTKDTLRRNRKRAKRLAVEIDELRREVLNFLENDPYQGLEGPDLVSSDRVLDHIQDVIIPEMSHIDRVTRKEIFSKVKKYREQKLERIRKSARTVRPETPVGSALAGMEFLGRELLKQSELFRSYAKKKGQSHRDVDFIVGWIRDWCNPEFNCWTALSHLFKYYQKQNVSPDTLRKRSERHPSAREYNLDVKAGSSTPRGLKP